MKRWNWKKEKRDNKKPNFFCEEKKEERTKEKEEKVKISDWEKNTNKTSGKRSVLVFVSFNLFYF